MLLLLVLPEEERFSVCPLETLLRLELLFLRAELELLFVRPLSRLELEVVELPLVGLRLEPVELEFVSGRRWEFPSPLLLFLSGLTSLFGFSFPDGVDGLVEVDGLCSVPGREPVDVPGREELPGRDEEPGRVVVPGRVDVPGRVVVDEPGREEFPGRTATPGRVGALCGRLEEFGRK